MKVRWASFPNLLEWGYSKVDWINLRRVFDRFDVKTFSLVYPVLGQYIVVSDNLFFTSPRFETYFLYFGLLMFSVLGILFSMLCPFYFKEFDDVRSFIAEYQDTQGNRERINRQTGSRQDFSEAGWSEVLTEVWEESAKMSFLLRWIFQVLICASFFFMIISAAGSIFRVLKAAVGSIDAFL